MGRTTRLGARRRERRNVISANGRDGIFIQESLNSTNGPDNNLIAGNFIGVDALGTLGLENFSNGIYISNSNGNTIGGTVQGAENLISANALNGILIQNDSTGTRISGNFIGTDISGTLAVDTVGDSLGNGVDGIQIAFASSNTVGGVVGNIISANGGSGIEIIGNGLSARATWCRGIFSARISAVPTGWVTR